MDNIISYIESNKERFLEELKEFLKIESISALPANKEATHRCAEWLENHLRSIGMQNVQLFETKGHPIVYGDRMDAPGKPTVLLYGHYDVQPVDPLNKWIDGPFEPTVRGEDIYARGATDDKGQVFVHFKSVEAYLQNKGALPVNLKMIIEGEEEIGSANLDAFVKEHKDLLAADIVLISDTSMYAKGVPTICYGLRGLSYFHIDVTGPNRDLHSGSFGGVIHNPAQALAELLARMHDKNGKITIPGFYDDVRRLTKEERKAFSKLPYSDKKYAKSLGVKELYGEKGYTTLERVWARPTFEINGIWGGFQGEGAKTVIPSKVGAKVSMRLVPDQDPAKIAKLFKRYVKEITPRTVQVDLTEMHGAFPAITPIDSLGVQAAAEALHKGFGKKPMYQREGGSIPIVVQFQQILNVSSVLLGFGLPNENAHSPNEHFNLDNFYSGIKTSAHFFDTLATMSKDS
jgi:acetylornithine deacetylase/succinyl-diaminopimelate desuccinylase-like protein